MEAVLNKLGNQPDLKSIEGLLDAIQRAKKNLEKPHSQSQPFERRQNCIDCFSIALATGRPKFATVAFEGIQLILRDNNEFGSELRTPEGQSRSEQLISLLSTIPNWNDSPTNQCQGLTVLVQLLSSTEISIRLKDVLSGLDICEQVYETTSQSNSVRPAARAALTQSLNSYVQNRLAVSSEEEEDEHFEHIGARMDITALISELVARMVGRSTVEKALGNKALNNSDLIQNQQQPLLLPLDALFSLLSALEPTILERHRPLFNSIKGELLPAIICYLHASGRKSSPNPETSETSKPSLLRLGRKQTTDKTNINSPSSAIISPTAKIALEGAESARSFNHVVEQLLRLFTPLALSSINSQHLNSPTTISTSNEILLLIEELWRSSLLIPPISKRTEAVRLIKRRCIDINSFGDFLQLNCASGTNCFWLFLIECLEECCCCFNLNNNNNDGIDKNNKMAIDVIRTLTCLFSAIYQIETLTFPSNFYSDLTKKEETSKNEVVEIKYKENKQDNKQNNFLNKLIQQFDNWEKCSSKLILDKKIIEFAKKITQENIFKAEQKLSEDFKELSANSTPEDSDNEKEEEKEEIDENNIIIKTELEEYAFLVSILFKFAIMYENENWIRDRKTLNQEASISSPNIQNFPLIEFLTSKQISRQLIEKIINKLNQNIKNKKINKFLNFFESDPLEDFTIEKTKENEKKQNNLLVNRWLRQRLRSCWSSIQKMLNQFPIRKGEATSIVITEDARLATVEALNAFIPLAIKLGLVPELYWAFEQISERICMLEDLRESAQRTISSNNNIIGGQDIKLVRRFINRPELLAIQGLIENAISALKIVPNVAKHVVRSIQFLWELERWHFKLAKTTIESIYDPPSPLLIDSSSSGYNSPLGQLIGAKMAIGRELNHSEIVKIMDHFLALIDNIFLSATKMLPLDSLCTFISEICNANENNLLYSSTIQTETTAQFLQRICQIICSDNITFLQKLCLWLSIRKHFVMCASNYSATSSLRAIPSEINRRAVDGLQEILNKLLSPFERTNSVEEKEHNLQGWNSLLFSSFTLIFSNSNKEDLEARECTLETALQIGNIFLNFIEVNIDLIGTGWTELFACLKLLIKRQHNINISSPSTTTIVVVEEMPTIPIPPLPALTAIIIEILNKFLENHIKRPLLFLSMFIEFCEVLLFALEATGSFDWKEQQRQSLEKEQQQYILILEKCENILLNYLLNSNLNYSTFPRSFIFKIKNKLKEKWENFLEFLTNKNRQQIIKKDDYLNLLPNLNKEICKKLKEEEVVANEEELLCSCNLNLKKWLESETLLEEVDKKSIDLELINQQPLWGDSSPTDLILLANLFELLEMLMHSMLPKLINETNGFIIQTPLCVKLAENIADFIDRVAVKIDLKLASFSTISCIISNFECSITSSLTINSTRAVKQSLGILICSHPFIENLFLNFIDKKEEKEREQWCFCLFKRLANLAVKCVAKGGALSLTGCALFQRLFTCLKNITNKSASIESIEGILFASSIWLASNYSLFPIRILISQFNLDSPVELINSKGNMRVSYRLGLTPEEVEERVNNVRQLAGQVFQLDGEACINKITNSEFSIEDEENKNNTLNIGANFPGKFAYLFLFENDNEGNRLSMGLDELLDSLLCHQLNIQIATEQLLFNNNSELQISLLLGCLYATIETCEKFEQRPGLKNLLQKLTDLQSPANLWNIYLSTINSLIKIEINQALNEQNDQNEEILNKKFRAHIKQIVKFLKRLGRYDEKKLNKREECVRHLAFTRLLNLIEENLNNLKNGNVEKKNEILKIIRETLAEEISNLLSDNSTKIFSDSAKNALEAFHKNILNL